jgi:tetratricopeptide (TPR) repeat protein
VGAAHRDSGREHHRGDGREQHSSDRRLTIGLALAAAAAVVALLLAGAAGGDDADDAAAVATPTTRDLSTVTDEEMEAVVAENPEVVGMRLALVERYLRQGELADAQRHAEQAAVRAETVDDRARALRYLGWTTALLGEPEQGEGLLVQSLALDPSDPDSLYFLGRVRFDLMGRADLAVRPLEELEGIDMTDEQRRLIDELLARVRVSLGVASESSTSTSTTTLTSLPG